MVSQPRNIQHSVEGSTLADVLERILDKGVVIVGDIRVKVGDVELLTVQIRLMIASVDKAKELGMDWWANNPAFNSHAENSRQEGVAEMKQRIERLELAAAAR